MDWASSKGFFFLLTNLLKALQRHPSVYFFVSNIFSTYIVKYKCKFNKSEWWSSIWKAWPDMKSEDDQVNSLVEITSKMKNNKVTCRRRTTVKQIYGIKACKNIYSLKKICNKRNLDYCQRTYDKMHSKISTVWEKYVIGECLANNSGNKSPLNLIIL